jgi:hypothetical protein
LFNRKFDSRQAIADQSLDGDLSIEQREFQGHDLLFLGEAIGDEVDIAPFIDIGGAERRLRPGSSGTGGGQIAARDRQLRGQLFIFLKQRSDRADSGRETRRIIGMKLRAGRVGDRDVALVTIEDGEADLYIRAAINDPGIVAGNGPPRIRSGNCDRIATRSCSSAAA